jgi:hypothetical protein
MFRQGNKIKISDTVYRKVRLAAEVLGCPVEDFIEKALQREAEKTISMTRRVDESSSEMEETAANQ